MSLWLFVTVKYLGCHGRNERLAECQLSTTTEVFQTHTNRDRWGSVRNNELLQINRDNVDEDVCESACDDGNENRYVFGMCNKTC
jgi:hypothetical protein